MDDLPLLASGRDADIYELDAGRVVRRARTGRSMHDEAKVMAYVRSCGYPAPEVFDVSDDGTELVMERIVGPTMLDAAARRPWRLGRFGLELGALHASLHAIDAPPWMAGAPVGEGTKVVHLDLHPLNVLLSSRGPVVIDWTNAARGDPAVDSALTWILLSAAEVPGGAVQALLARVGRSILVRGFLATTDVDDLRRVGADVVGWKCTDPNMSEVEQARMRALVAK